MIDTLIFDVSETLVNFGFRKVMKDMGFTGSCVGEIRAAIYDTGWWRKLDRGVITLEEAIKGICAEAEPYHRQVEYFVRNYGFFMTPLANNICFLEAAHKSAKYRLFYLSDFHEHGWKILTERNRFFKLFEGGIVSYECHYLKPEREIFDHIAKRFDIDRGRALFIDDRKKNTDKAREFGFHSLNFVQGDDIFVKAREFGIELDDSADILKNL